jgi:Rieske Fe-S protein
VGVVVFMVGLIISWWIAGLGALVALAFAFLWVRDLTAGSALTHTPEVEPESATDADTGPAELEPSPAEEERYGRSKFLELSTLGLGGVIGGIVTAPAVGFMIAPSFLKQGTKDHDIGPITDFPQDKYVIATYMSDPKQGEVSRRTAYVRNNGDLNGQPSFTVISNHCAHLGCPVQPNGPLDTKGTKQFGDVTLIPTVSIAGFGCPCHGGQYDIEGNRVAGPPVRALDRYSYSIRNGRVFLGKPYSVSSVTNSGAQAVIHEWRLSFPGEHVNGIESWLYPVQPPH